MKVSMILLISLISGLKIQTAEAGKVVVKPGSDLNAVINDSKGGDTIIINPGTYPHFILSGKKCTEKNPLIIRAIVPASVVISGSTVSNGCALEIISCSYVVIEDLTFTNSMWGIYVKNSDHIILRKNEVYNTGQEGIHIGRSSKFVDVSGNRIHNTGKYNPKWAEGIYVGSGSYSGSNFPDNCEYIWIEGNHIYETGKAEGINIKGESFHVTVINNKIHDIHPGTSEQYNQAGITVEGAANSIENNYRLSEKRDVWIVNNTIRNVSKGYSDWNNGIMFFGTGVYILNNTVDNCSNKGIFGSNWKNIGLENYVYGNKISSCGTIMDLHPELKIFKSDPGKSPHTPQKWYR